MALISYMTDALFAPGAVRELPGVLATRGIRRPLVVGDKGVVAAGLVKAATAGVSNTVLFDDTPPNPTEAAVEAAAQHYKNEQCDGVVAIGGGSAIDLAKAAALLATHAGRIGDYAVVANGADKITAAVAPLIAIPTTAGSGSEVGRASLIVLNDQRKVAIISPLLLPKLAICDPDMTQSLPPSLAAGSGMDAIAHCVEALLSPRINPPADAIALDGLARAVGAIERAAHQAHDDAARADMMMASLQGGLAFQKGLGAVHALSHALGALKEPVLHHGTLNGILLPAVLRFNAAVCAEPYRRMRAALRLSNDADLATFFADLHVRLGLPPRLRSLGLGQGLLPRLAAEAMRDLSHHTNPLAASEADYRALLTESW
jgi:alcohol dehydrogenase class IV